MFIKLSVIETTYVRIGRIRNTYKYLRGEISKLVLYKDDMELVKRVCSGKTSALEEFITKFDQQIRLSIKKFFLDNDKRGRSKKYWNDIVEDLTRDLYRNLLSHNYQRLRQYHGEYKISTWLSTICVNIAIDWYKKKENNKEIISFEYLAELESDDEESNRFPRRTRDKLGSKETPFDEAVNNERKKLLEYCTSFLTEYEKVLFKLRYEQGLSQKKISRVVKRNQGTVGSDLSRLKTKFKQLIEQKGINISDLLQ